MLYQRKKYSSFFLYLCGVLIELQNHKKKLKIFSPFYFIIAFFFNIPILPTHAEGSVAASSLDSAKSSLDSANSAASTAKETSKNISEFSAKAKSFDDDSGGKQPPAVPPKNLVAQKPGSFLERFFGKICSVQINIEKNANSNSAILSELVIIYKPELYSQISLIPIKDWFTFNADAIKTLRTSKDVQIYRFELTPDSNYSKYLIDINSNASGAFLFNRLSNNANAYPIQLNPYKNLKLNFFSLGFDYFQEMEK
ncbi:hypothetical protein [Silvanigrella aquatica]|uniref:Uncharacterized protein n=1 Tax=Silvanigrella aquatica TaxID=1915309 RepID=A0A1L4CZ24_9BACT|nr:hypothetical protein [Silvanigrella aquatica]APJ03202.1 hypothetical protein AXG55_04505 [Silvanigrella aquatica]